MKKFSSVLLAFALLFTAVTAFTACGGRAPKIEEIYDRIVSLIEASYEINDLFYGKGLPYYDRELPIYRDLYSDYTTLGYTENYHIVRSDAKYRSIDSMKMAAEEVYTRELLDLVYRSAFEGVVVNDAVAGVASSDAQYLQTNDHLYISKAFVEGHHPTPMVYDYATMEVIRPSNATRVFVTMNAWEESSPTVVREVRITLALQDGAWLLDSLTV